ncbi:tRNA pseudouridine(13) synthase TruD [Euryarchaeota archaeon ex4484_178]|nr:MAG: tRNA pseudouridine(13) synthase TruD [Euryarchaeota archaeon ex4484_178]
MCRLPEEKDIGIFSFLSKSPGVGGKLRKRVEDFFVEEIPKSFPKKTGGKNLWLKIKLRNWETNRFIKILSRNLGISRHRIRFAGTKDKRAITIQYFCILNYPWEINLNLKDVEILEIFRSDACLDLGDLLGNKFRIVLSDAICDERIRNVEEELNGFFPNFFGVQRFGASRPITHIVGKFILLGEFEEAVRYYIGYPSPFEHDEGRRIFFDTLDAREALKNIGKADYERAMLNYLILHPGDYAGALKSLPNNLLLLFIHAYQAYLFNIMVSRRLEHGIELEDGDVVMKVDQNGLPIQEFVSVNSFNRNTIQKRILERKAYLSTILPGYKIEFSGGIQGEIERDVMEEEGITPEMFRIKEMRELSSKGRRRNILSPIGDYKRSECLFEFFLYRGSYATSLMREFMKQKELHFY